MHLKMEVTIKITGEDGQVREVSRILNINKSVDIIQEIEREIGVLHQTLTQEVFEEVLNTEQSLYSLEKKI